MLLGGVQSTSPQNVKTCICLSTKAVLPTHSCCRLFSNIHFNNIHGKQHSIQYTCCSSLFVAAGQSLAVMLVLHAPPSTTTTIHTTTLLHRSPCTPSTSRNAFFTQHHTSWGRRPCPHPHHLHPTCNAAFADPQSVEAGENYARARQSLVAKEEEVKFTPAYNKYLTRTEINENKIRYWKRILVRDTPQVLGVLWCVS